MKNLYVCLWTFIVLSSCRHADRKAFVDETNTTVIELRSKPLGKISLNTFVDSVKFVKLETTDECLIQRIGKVFVAGEKIIVPDYKNHEVFFFDAEGRYLYKISRKGRGPQEYYRITSAMFDPETNNVLIHCLEQNKVLFYDLDGKFIREISDFSGDMLVRDVINLPNGNFLCYEGTHNPDGNVERVGLWEVDSDGGFLKWLLKPQRLHPTIGNAVSTNLHYRNGYEVGFWDTFTDDDFHYRNDTLRLTRTYDLPLRRGKDIPGVYRTDEKFASRIYMVEKGNFAMSEWYDDQDNKSIAILHSVRDNMVLSGVAIDYRNTSGIPALSGQILDNNLDDVFVEAIYSTMVLMYAKDTQSPYFSPGSLKILSELTQGMSEKEKEDMNPILEFYYLKK